MKPQQRLSATFGARLSFARRLRKRVPTRIPENVSGGDDDVLRRLMRASTRGMPFKGGCDAHLCLNEGFTLWDFRWNSLFSREHNMRRVLRGLVLSDRKSQ